MPVTFTVAAHGASPVQLPESHTALEILDQACGSAKDQTEDFEVIQSSISPSEYPAVNPSPNGFVHTVLEAYGNHRKLVIRPDDVWTAILVQFQLYVNANAEKLRSSFVAHEGKKELLIIVAASSRYEVDFGWFARRMSELLHDNLVDKDLVRWVLPDFSTTTLTDTTVCSIALMATLNAYFQFRCTINCGIPQVTLEGEKQDWVNILSRLDKLADFGDQPLAWSHLLRTIITRFISSFDSPDAPENIKFWQQIAHNVDYGCNIPYISGWITAFCVWNERGMWTGPFLPDLLKGDVVDHPDTRRFGPREGANGLILDGRPFTMIEIADIPAGYASVPVKVDDNGTEFNCEMIAGQIGWHVLSRTSADLSSAGPVLGDKVQPATAWFIYERKVNQIKVVEKKRREEETKRRREEEYRRWHEEFMQRIPEAYRHLIQERAV